MVATAPADEVRLHQRLLLHDLDAIALVYDQYAATVFGVALRVTADRHAAEDVTQEVLLGVWRRPERYDPERGGLRPWLAAIAHNRSVDWIRRERAAQCRDRSQLARDLAEQVPDIDDHVQAWMAAERVRQAVSKLPVGNGRRSGWPTSSDTVTARWRSISAFRRGPSSHGSGAASAICPPDVRRVARPALTEAVAPFGPDVARSTGSDCRICGLHHDGVARSGRTVAQDGGVHPADARLPVVTHAVELAGDKPFGRSCCTVRVGGDLEQSRARAHPDTRSDRGPVHTVDSDVLVGRPRPYRVAFASKPFDDRDQTQTACHTRP